MSERVRAKNRETRPNGSKNESTMREVKNELGPVLYVSDICPRVYQSRPEVLYVDEQGSNV